jgi:hypothetical protein
VAKQFHATIGIEATPERVWQVLTDLAAYPDWNPFITRASGPSAPASACTCVCGRPAAVAPPCGPPCWRPTPAGGCAG